ncbi:MAG TPA: hypothetical protein VE964_05345 [Myxococcales bacterium]|nr:hypothetical protein [Myxococcales bacterium]
MRVACGVLAALLFATEASAGSPEPCSLAGGKPWREFRSQHFVIDAAGWNREPARLVGSFEELYAAVLASLIAEPVDIPGRVRVVVLPGENDLFDYTGSSDIAALFWVSPRGEPVILLSADNVESVPQVVAHELTHHVSSYLFPRQPFWFAEGLAQFVESVGKPDREGRRWAGSDPTGGWVAGDIKLTRMESLLTLNSSGSYVDSLSSWVLYRFLWNERPRQLTKYQRALMDGEAPQDAWRLAFPEWDPKAGNAWGLDAPVIHHQLNGRGLRWEIKLGKVDRTFTSAPASPGDVHIALLDLRLDVTNSLLKQRVRRQSLEEADREEAGHPVVSAELARLREVPLLPALRASAAARPGDGRGWFLLGMEATDPGEREAALRRAVELWPEGALAQAALATQLATTGRAREGLAAANRAVELAPWHPTAVSSLATVAVELGQCKQALLLQARAVEAAQAKRVGTAGVDSDQLKNRLAELQKRCSKPAPPR